MDDIDLLARHIASHLPRDPPVSEAVAEKLARARQKALAQKRAGEEGAGPGIRPLADVVAVWLAVYLCWLCGALYLEVTASDIFEKCVNELLIQTL